MHILWYSTEMLFNISVPLQYRLAPYLTFQGHIHCATPGDSYELFTELCTSCQQHNLATFWSKKFRSLKVLVKMRVPVYFFLLLWWNLHSFCRHRTFEYAYFTKFWFSFCYPLENITIHSNKYKASEIFRKISWIWSCAVIMAPSFPELVWCWGFATGLWWIMWWQLITGRPLQWVVAVWYVCLLEVLFCC